MIINKNFTYFIIGQTISEFGSTLFRMTYLWYIGELFNQGAIIGVLYGFSSIFSLISNLFNGNIVDYFDKKKVLIVSDIAGSILMLYLIILVKMEISVVILFIVFSSLFSIIGNLEVTTRASFVQWLVPESLYHKAISIQTLVQNISEIFLPIISMVIVSQFGVSTCFIINAASFVVSVMCTSLINNFQMNTHSKKSNQNFLSQYKMGIDYIANNFSKLFIFMIFPFINFLSSPLLILIRIMIKDNGLNINDLFLFGIASGLGNILCALYIIKFVNEPQKHNKHILDSAIGTLIVSLGFLILGFAHDMILISIGGALISIGFAYINTMLFSYAKKVISKAFYGRTLSVLFVINGLMMPLGNFIFGYLSDIFVVNFIFFSIFLGIFLFSVLFFFIYILKIKYIQIPFIGTKYLKNLLKLNPDLSRVIVENNINPKDILEISENYLLFHNKSRKLETIVLGNNKKSKRFEFDEYLLNNVPCIDKILNYDVISYLESNKIPIKSLNIKNDCIDYWIDVGNNKICVFYLKLL